MTDTVLEDVIKKQIGTVPSLFLTWFSEKIDHTRTSTVRAGYVICRTQHNGKNRALVYKDEVSQDGDNRTLKVWLSLHRGAQGITEIQVT